MISILMPIYNGIEFFEESLNSIIKQTYKNWELIIGINGHPENSDIQMKALEIINNYNSIYNYDIKLKWYDTKGKPASLNAMVKDTKYNYIALLDVDDIWIENKLEKQVLYLNTYDVIGTGCRYFGNANHIPNIPYGNLNNFNFFQFNPIINSSVIIKKELAFWNENEFLDDYDLWLRLSKEKKSFFNISELLVLHRIHNTSAFNNTNDNYVNNLKLKSLNY